jgi:hypothetical protein
LYEGALLGNNLAVGIGKLWECRFMVYPPGQGKFGEYLMSLWRRYLEQYAENEGDIESQIVVGSYHAAEVFGCLSLMMDREGMYQNVIKERITHFRTGSEKAELLDDCLVNATFALYNHMNTLSHQLCKGNEQAESLIQQIDKQVYLRTHPGTPGQRSAAALAAVFPLLSIMTLALDDDGATTSVIRRIEQRFASAAQIAATEWDPLLNALYRLVEMMQVFAFLTDVELQNQINQIANRFKEEDQARDLQHKLRNGFCRLFELGHLVTTHLDGIQN